MIFYRFFKPFTNLISLVTLKIRKTLAIYGPTLRNFIVLISTTNKTISSKEQETTKKSNYLQPSKK